MSTSHLFSPFWQTHSLRIENWKSNHLGPFSKVCNFYGKSLSWGYSRWRLGPFLGLLLLRSTAYCLVDKFSFFFLLFIFIGWFFYYLVIELYVFPVVALFLSVVVRDRKLLVLSKKRFRCFLRAPLFLGKWCGVVTYFFMQNK